MELVNLPDDMTFEEKDLLREYKKNGCPGLVKITAEKVQEWFNLYMGGKTYTEISKITKTKKDLILYISQKSNWHSKRIDKYSDIAENILEKTKSTALDSADTVSTMILAWNRYYNKRLNKYLKTNDDSIMEDLDVKKLAEYRKTIDSLEKFVSGFKGKDKVPSPPTERSSVNININTPSEIVEGENCLDISKSKNNSDIIKTLLTIRDREKK
jgi:hypothetical protein